MPRAKLTRRSMITLFGIEVGKRADLVVLDRNLFEGTPGEISDARVVLTVFGGRDVFP